MIKYLKLILYSVLCLMGLYIFPYLMSVSEWLAFPSMLFGAGYFLITGTLLGKQLMIILNKHYE